MGRTEPGPCYGPDCDHVSHASRDRTRPCGCRYISPCGAPWYQVVACPDHDMAMAPRDQPPADAT